MKIKIFIAILILFLSFVYQEYPKWRNYNDDFVHVYFLDVGQGDAILIKDNRRRLFLIDGGPNRQIIFQLSNILPFWINRIDYVIASHPHADHITGLFYVLQKYDVDCIVYYPSSNPISNVDKEFQSLISNLAISECENDEISHWQFNLSTKLGDENLNSVVAMYSYKDFDVLLTGDAEIETQKKMLQYIEKDIEVIKVPHHGSFDSYYLPFLYNLRPELAVISVGENNRFNHPNQKTVDGYTNLGINILRTDLNETIHIRSDGNRWEVVK
ncbi:hypothetical protein CO178_00075 [candidate division WWE3 bacterium CG_4_9_14_3_um_filter_34_6]|uniref:Metallo-beta-lactamase domain-containing protein n=1 Tax=candidate division WWE3 bacterium CG_4_9_14_3_um_filter_34_6 TaxID=1975079 RepID=A0A2M7X5Q6_UNCKA|nr:MAG: hypothetical protein CO178_00075 [candidate division WWE3 bacterium CG_4_9_14_3_um_filter_34_6]